MNNESPMQKHYRDADRVMYFVNLGLIVYSLGLASWFDTWTESIVICLLTGITLTAVYKLSPGTAISRSVMAAAFMVMTALHIHQAHGMIELHFGVFVLLAILLYYRDWLPILVAAGVIAVHHFSFYYFQLSGSSVWILRSTENGWWVIFLHAAYVVVESSILLLLSLKLKKDAIQSIEIMSLTDHIIGEECIDLTHRSSAATPLLCRFDDYTEEVAKLAERVTDTSEDLNQRGEALANVTEGLRQLSETQQKETDMIATAVEEMSAAIVEVSRNAEEAADSANEIDINAQESKSVGQKTQNSVAQLAGEVNRAAETMATLNQQSNDIGTVLDVIRGIAEQTNLLALNAAIEAARAGEQGRGFAVVADEVRTLAQRTQQSTEEINQMIEKLQLGSKSAVEAIESSRSHADRCVENTKESLVLMEQVSGSIEEINKKSSMIATAAGEQTGVIDEISRNVNNILNASNQAAEDSVMASDSGQELLSMATGLRQLTSRFKVST
ncbi:MAG: methyl-accepting chemotaxis protein [Candidatus Pelagadaptatus aseana]|uniref:methyl-accepting chemotaxis protein n=1 Tax=Candidatus Pelagadaptatus aseana TaxID=3120508 RepID=UPI0039B1E347